MAYDASREQTLQGTVVGVKVDARGPGRMVLLTFSTDAATWKVMAGPQEVLRKQGLSLAVKDVLTIVGAPAAVPDGQGFVARTITRDGTTVTLLDADGRPMGGPGQPGAAPQG
jgi:hypothetical protein